MISYARPHGRAWKRLLGMGAAVTAVIIAVAACSSGGSSSGGTSAAGIAWSHVTSAAEGGGMAALVKAAKAEGSLNLIAIPRTWANYGGLMDAFTKQYGIKISVTNPEGSSQDALNACSQLKGTSRAPDDVEVGTSFAPVGISDGLFAQYRVQSWAKIPAAEKDPQGRWTYDYAGLMSIGYNSADFRVPPTSFKSLLAPEYKNAVTLTGSPTSSGDAFGAVFAAALGNGGSVNDIQPGVSYFARLTKAGNFSPVESTPAGIESGQIKLTIAWSFLNAQWSAVNSKWKVVVPSDGQYLGYYVQAVCSNSPHPAAARLWQEFMYSNTGQNLWIQGGVRPVLLQSMVAARTVDHAAYKALPAPSGTPKFANAAQQAVAQGYVDKTWSSAVGS